MSAPNEITRDQLLEALEPLGTLLDLDFREAYAPIVIGWESVGVVHSPAKTPERAAAGVGNDWSVHAIFTSVKVTD